MVCWGIWASLSSRVLGLARLAWQEGLGLGALLPQLERFGWLRLIQSRDSNFQAF